MAAPTEFPIVTAARVTEGMTIRRKPGTGIATEWFTVATTPAKKRTYVATIGNKTTYSFTSADGKECGGWAGSARFQVRPAEKATAPADETPVDAKPGKTSYAYAIDSSSDGGHTFHPNSLVHWGVESVGRTVAELVADIAAWHQLDRPVSEMMTPKVWRVRAWRYTSTTVPTRDQIDALAATPAAATWLPPMAPAAGCEHTPVLDWAARGVDRVDGSSVVSSTCTSCLQPLHAVSEFGHHGAGRRWQLATAVLPDPEPGVSTIAAFDLRTATHAGLQIRNRAGAEWLTIKTAEMVDRGWMPFASDRAVEMTTTEGKSGHIDPRMLQIRCVPDPAPEKVLAGGRRVAIAAGNGSGPVAGHVIRTWVVGDAAAPDVRAGRWYSVSVEGSGEVVAKRRHELAPADGPGPSGGARYPVIFEAEHLVCGRWRTLAADFSAADSYAPADLAELARRIADHRAEETLTPVRVTLHAVGDPSAYAYETAEPRGALVAA